MGDEVKLDSIDVALASLAKGGAVVVVDDENRENEGDIVFAAQFATSKLLAWMVRYTSGVICVPMQQSRANFLALPPMVLDNKDPKGTAYTVSCDAVVGVSTGISAADRALTIRKLADSESVVEDFSRPGHVFPLVSVSGGVRQRLGHTEAAVELCVLAGCEPVGVIAEIVREDGSMMRLQELVGFAREFCCPIISIADLVVYVEEGAGACG